MSIGVEVLRTATASGNQIVLRIKGTAHANVQLDVWFENQPASLTSTTSDESGNFTVDLTITPPPPGEHQVFVKDKSPDGKTVPKAVMFPIPVRVNR